MRLELLPYLIISHTYLFTPPKVSRSFGLDFPFHRGGRCWFRKVRQKVMSVLCRAAAHSYQFGALRAKVPGHPPAFVSPHLSHLRDLPPLPGCFQCFLQPGHSPSSFWAPGPWFSHSKQSMCRSTMPDQPPDWWFCLTSLLIEGFRTCHFCLVQVLWKFTTSL